MANGPDGKQADELPPGTRALLDVLAGDALRHPEEMGDVGQLFSGDESLLDGVVFDS